LTRSHLNLVGSRTQVHPHLHAVNFSTGVEYCDDDTSVIVLQTPSIELSIRSLLYPTKPCLPLLIARVLHGRTSSTVGKPQSARSLQAIVHLTDSTEACQEYQIAAPVFQIVSDRRGQSIMQEWLRRPRISSSQADMRHAGGRTAWSSRVTVHGSVHSARYWYDGKNLNNAKEDAAEVALNWLNGSNPSSPSTTKGGW
jgi:hypothetical protein